MEPFTDESTIRARLHLPEAVSTADIATALADAHERVTALLDPETIDTPVSELLRLGETYLAGAELFRSFYIRAVYDQRRLTVGGARIEEGPRAQALGRTARECEQWAWSYLAPYLFRPAPRKVVATTPTWPL